MSLSLQSRLRQVAPLLLLLAGAVPAPAGAEGEASATSEILAAVAAQPRPGPLPGTSWEDGSELYDVWRRPSAPGARSAAVRIRSLRVVPRADWGAATSASEARRVHREWVERWRQASPAKKVSPFPWNRATSYDALRDEVLAGLAAVPAAELQALFEVVEERTMTFEWGVGEEGEPAFWTTRVTGEAACDAGGRMVERPLPEPAPVRFVVEWDGSRFSGSNQQLTVVRTHGSGLEALLFEAPDPAHPGDPTDLAPISRAELLEGRPFAGALRAASTLADWHLLDIPFASTPGATSWFLFRAGETRPGLQFFHWADHAIGDTMANIWDYPEPAASTGTLPGPPARALLRLSATRPAELGIFGLGAIDEYLVLSVSGTARTGGAHEIVAEALGEAAARISGESGGVVTPKAVVEDRRFDPPATYAWSWPLPTDEQIMLWHRQAQASGTGGRLLGDPSQLPVTRRSPAPGGAQGGAVASASGGGQREGARSPWGASRALALGGVLLLVLGVWAASRRARARREVGR